VCNPRHAPVLVAVEVAATQAGRAVCVAEVSSALTEEASAALRRNYPQRTVRESVAKILDQLLDHGRVRAVDKAGGKRYYASAAVGSSLPSVVRPTPQSARQQVHEAVRRAVNRLGRPVRLRDVLDELSPGPTQALAPRAVVRAMTSLKNTGDIRVVGGVRGGGRDGSRLVAPCGWNSGTEATAPLTWLEAVLQAFMSLWKRQCADDPDGRSPPLLSRDVAAALHREGRYPERLADSRSVPNALLQLARGANPPIRRVPGPTRLAQWVPADTRTAEVDVTAAFASDVDRLAEAVARAIATRGYELVSAREVADEIARDTQLALVGQSSVARALSEASRPDVPTNTGGRVPRKRARIVQVGRVRGTSWYAGTPDGATVPKAARCRFALLELAAEWENLDAWNELTACERAHLPRVREARRARLSTTAHSILGRALEIANTGLPVAEEAMHLVATLRELTSRLNEKSSAALQPLSDHGIGLTADELVAYVLPFKPAYARLEGDTAAAISLFEKRVRRIPAPVQGDRRSGPEFLFDRADALFYLAREWGGAECVLLSGIAEAELGPLRDQGALAEGLQDASSAHRLITIACLAFLCARDALPKLEELALTETEEGIRRAALWASGWLDTGCGIRLAQHISAEDASWRVREFAARASAAHSWVDWWRL
jgi:hypothetical protein